MSYITRYSYECTENRGICETPHKKAVRLPSPTGSQDAEN